MKGRSDLLFLWWALRDSNPRPSPCKGERKPQVRALSRGNAVSLGTAEYLGVPSDRYADVMRGLRRCRFAVSRGLIEAVDFRHRYGESISHTLIEHWELQN